MKSPLFIKSCLLFTVFVGLAAVAGTTSLAQSGTTDLFNGKDLVNWEQRGGKATYAVEDGAIVGTSVPNTGNSFLCTKETYGNFILELDYKVDPGLNSGVQFRSECFDHEVTFTPKDVTAKSIKIPANRVHGYQCEIDMNPGQNRWWTAGIYEEGRRGWLFPGEGGGDKKEFTEQGRNVSKAGDWNHLRIEASGTSIKTFLNGVPRAVLIDGVTATGFIALQVHAIGGDAAKAGMKASFKNIRIQNLSEIPVSETKPLEAASVQINMLTPEEKARGWRLLWDGRTFDGWQKAVSGKLPDQGWEIKDGVLSVQGANGGESANGGDIVSHDKFSNFELVADFKITPGANSGIKYFVNTDLNKGPGSAIGLEYQILDDLRHPDAKLGRDGNRTMASLYDLIPAATTKKPNPIGEWNTARIVSRGHHIEHWLNGEKVLEYERGSKEFRDRVAASKYAKWGDFGELPDGPILLQDHGNAVSFRNIKIRVLPAE